MSDFSKTSDYSRYFNLKQKVYLVNVSEDRNTDVYESLTGIVTSSAADSLDLMIANNGHGLQDGDVGKAVFKLTSEALGSGIQVLADLAGIAGGNVFRFRMHGALEMFQRRSVPRIEITVPFFHLCGNFRLESLKSEWKRIMEYQKKSGALPAVTLKETDIKLSAGGIGFMAELNKRPTPLSMIFFTLDEGLPVCAVAENVWGQNAGEGVRCGFRFIHILKSDQERIRNFIGDIIRKCGGTYLDFKRNWELVDKMAADVRKTG